MHFEEHLLIGWHVSQFSGLDSRSRGLVTLCAVLPDVDALSVLFGRESYLHWHHTFGHSFLFGAVLCTAALFSRSDRPARFAFFCGLAFLSHLAADLVGTRWALYVFWPFSDHPLYSPYGWWLGAWQNRAVLLALLAFVPASAAFFGHSPFELLNPRLDRMFLAMLRDKFRPNSICSCGERCLGFCAECGTPICLDCTALGNGLTPLCHSCNARITAAREETAGAPEQEHRPE